MNTDRIFSLHQKKDYDYYSGVNTNRWNKKSIQSKKMLKLYHDREDQKNQLFKQYEDQMNLKEDLQKTQQLCDTLQFKNAQKEEIQNQKLKRKLLQFQSNQCFDVMDQQQQLEELIQTNEDFKRPLVQDKMVHQFKQTNRGFNFWNDYKNICKKNIDQVLTKKVLDKDEFAVKTIQNKIQNDHDHEQLVKEYQRFIHDLTLQKFYERQKQNQDLHQKLRIEKKSDKQLSTPFYNNYESFQRIAQNKKHLSVDKIKALSQDFHGLFLGDVDLEKNQQKHVPYINKVRNSQLLQKKIQFLENEKTQRHGTFRSQHTDIETTRQKLLTTNLSKTLQKPLRQTKPEPDPFPIDLNQLDEFDNKFQLDKGVGSIGYPKIQLLAIQNFEKQKI